MQCKKYYISRCGKCPPPFPCLRDPMSSSLLLAVYLLPYFKPYQGYHPSWHFSKHFTSNHDAFIVVYFINKNWREWLMFKIWTWSRVVDVYRLCRIYDGILFRHLHVHWARRPKLLRKVVDHTVGLPNTRLHTYHIICGNYITNLQVKSLWNFVYYYSNIVKRKFAINETPRCSC